MKFIVILFVGLSWAFSAMAGAPAAHPMDTLAYAFRTCDLPTNRLAIDLMRSATDVTARTSFPRRHPEVGPVALVLSDDTPDMVSVTVPLVDATPIAGSFPAELMAASCKDACDTMVWTLNFGKLSPDSLVRLKLWAHEQPRTDKPKPEVHEDIDGSTLLACHFSM